LAIIRAGQKDNRAGQTGNYWYVLIIMENLKKLNKQRLENYLREIKK
jgi:hypothetical protein